MEKIKCDLPRQMTEKIEMEMTPTKPIRQEFDNIYNLGISHGIDTVLDHMTDNIEINTVLIEIVKKLRKLQSK